jgi:predicted  nucleic acid-binding Zn-ribbon protein
MSASIHIDHKDSDSVNGNASILTASTQYNDQLAQRQAEVRAALNDLYGGDVHVGGDGDYRNNKISSYNDDMNPGVRSANANASGTYAYNHSTSNSNRYSNPSPQLQLAFEMGMSMDDGESLSFDPLVVHDTDATGVQDTGINRNEHEHEHEHEHYSPIMDDGESSSSSDGDSLSSFSLSLLGDMNLNTSASLVVSPNDLTSKAAMNNTHGYGVGNESVIEAETDPNSVLMSSARQQTSLHQASNAANHLTPVQEVTDGNAKSVHNNTMQSKHDHDAKKKKDSNNNDAHQNKEIQDLQTLKTNLEEQITILQADQVLLARSPTKYQVELDSMRLVADQVQIEAKERIMAAEMERDEVRNRFEDLLRNGNGTNGGGGGADSGEGHHGIAYQRVLYALLEQLCLLEESGLRKDASYPMDHVVKDAMKVTFETQTQIPMLMNQQYPEMEERIQQYLERLAKGCGSSNLIDSILSEEGQDRGVDVSEIASPTGNYVSAGVDTEGLVSNMQTLHNDIPSSLIVEQSHSHSQMQLQLHTHSSTVSLHQTMSELQLENASLKGSNQHMNEQLDRYKQQLQSLRASSAIQANHSNSIYAPSPSLSSSTVNTNHNHFNEGYKELKQSNLQLSRQIQILSESKQAVEEENAIVVQRCVVLENVAEDATRECERLHHLGEGTESIQRERDELLALHANYDEVAARREEEHDTLRKEMKDELEALQGKCNTLVESSVALEKEVESLKKRKIVLESELESVNCFVEKQQEELSKQSLQSSLEREKEWPQQEDQIVQLSPELNRLTEDRDELLGEVKKLQECCKIAEKSSSELEDECNRLRNLNAMIKAKIEMTESDLHMTKKENSSFAKEISSLRKEFDSTRNENVSLSDIKTDMQIKLKELEDECLGYKASLAKLENEFSEVVSLRIELQKQNDIFSDELSSKDVALTNANENLSEILTEKNTVESQLEELRTKAGSLKEQLNHLQPRIQQQEKRVVFEEEISPINGSCRKWVQGYNSQQGSVGVQTPEASGFGYDSWALLDSTQKAITHPGESLTPGEVGSIKSIDDQLERIKHAKERAMRTLKNVSNLQSSASKQSKKHKFDGRPEIAVSSNKSMNTGTSRIEETEAFVNDILNSCGKQTLAL